MTMYYVDNCNQNTLSRVLSLKAAKVCVILLWVMCEICCTCWKTSFPKPSPDVGHVQNHMDNDDDKNELINTCEQLHASSRVEKQTLGRRSSTNAPPTLGSAMEYSIIFFDTFFHTSSYDLNPLEIFFQNMSKEVFLSKCQNMTFYFWNCCCPWTWQLSATPKSWKCINYFFKTCQIVTCKLFSISSKLLLGVNTASTKLSIQ